MPPGRPALDADAKRQRRQEALQRYAAKNAESLRAAARTRMRTLRATADEAQRRRQRQAARSSAATYRQKHRAEIREADALRRETALKVQEEEHRARRLARQAERRKKPPRAAPHPFLRRRYDPKEVLTANQKRCRALRASGLEDDNGDDSDEDIPPGMCGCNLSECQLLHKNESAKRKDWKIFHLKHPDLDSL
ncbi:hypothetical protein C8R46DRAFT_1233025 [Mycena filopes]|nr:hypothetical protein C8R46DRAFT_1233025 [Mycena filopes]